MSASSPYSLTVDRSGGRCEALVQVRDTWTRCFRSPIEVHHKLTRARGGDVLDRMGETYHLMALCRKCHTYAHDEGSAIANGMLIEGKVYVEGPIVRYVGPDPYLNDNYARGVHL